MFAANPEYDSLISGDISYGPRVGFLQGAAIAHDAGFDETEGGNNFNMHESYYEQRRLLEAQGFALPELRSKSGDPLEPTEIGRYFETGEGDVDTNSLSLYDNKIDEIRRTSPGVKARTNSEIWADTQKEAQASAAKLQNTRTTTGGAIGEFIGGAGAGVNPIANFTNAATLPLGGGGKTVVTRIATEAGAQALVESANETLGGGRSTRDLLGLDSSLEGSITRVGMAGVGGGFIRGVFEGGAAGYRAAGRRWFADSIDDPAPPPTFKPSEPVEVTPEQRMALLKALPETANPELARTRIGTGRVLDDLRHVQERLEAWDGESPIDIAPRTDTAIPRDTVGVRLSEDVTTREAFDKLTVDEKARRIDPDSFRIYDGLAAKVEAIRQELSSNRPDTNEWARLITEANNKVSDITEQMGDRKLSKTKRAALDQERQTLMAQRDTLMQQPRGTDTPRQTQLREQLLHHDVKMRDLAPVISRAYTNAQGSFTASEATRAAVKNMVKERAARVTDGDARAIVDSAQANLMKPSTFADQAPIMSRATAADFEAGKPLVHAALRVVERDAKLADESLESFRSSLDSILKDEKTGTVTIGDHTFDLKDRLEVPGLDGEGVRTISVRELLDEMREADYEAKAVQTCSI